MLESSCGQLFSLGSGTLKCLRGARPNSTTGTVQGTRPCRKHAEEVRSRSFPCSRPCLTASSARITLSSLSPFGVPAHESRLIQHFAGKSYHVSAGHHTDRKQTMLRGLLSPSTTAGTSTAPSFPWPCMTRLSCTPSWPSRRLILVDGIARRTLLWIQLFLPGNTRGGHSWSLERGSKIRCWQLPSPR
jgi:hypothetical protein